MKNMNFTKAVVVCSSMLLSGIVLAQTGMKGIRGTICDESGEPIIGVSVTVKGTSSGTISGLDGKFTLSISDKVVIEISFVGYEAQEIKMNTPKTGLKIALCDDAEPLEEVVVVGYGVQKKSDLTSAVATVKSDELAATSVISLDQGLQGCAAEVVVLNTSGQPGAGTSIRIRSTSSINGNNEPLYVTDGIPVISDTSSFSTGALQNPALNPLTNTSSNDIEPIEILKNASATPIYGAHGANGIVLITTKQGKSGKSRVSIGAKLTLQQVVEKMDTLNPVQLAELANEVADNDGVERSSVFAGLNNLSKIDTDWQDEIFRIAPMQNYDISVLSGNDKTTYFISGNLLLQDGIIIGSGFGKGSSHANLNQQVNKWLKAGISTNLNYSCSDGVVTNAEGGFASSVTSWVLEMNLGLPVRDSEENYTYESNMKSPNVGNPVQDALEAKNRNTSFRTLANTFLEYMPTKGLTFKTSIDVDYFYIKDQSSGAGELKRAESNGGYANTGNRDGYNRVWENTVNYNQTFDDHTLGTSGGTTAQVFAPENSSVLTADFENGFLGFNPIRSDALHQAANSGITEWQILSYSARINYGYKGRYLLTSTGRVDGSSKFDKGNKYGFSPSVTSAWRAPEENFMKETRAVSSLKLRAGYGVVGNEDISSYSLQGLVYNAEAYSDNTGIVKGLTPLISSNRDSKWETTSQVNVGIDLGLSKNRLTSTVNYYYKKTRDLSLTMPVAFNTGYDSVVSSVGNLTNQGFEVTLSAIPFAGKLSWNMDFTLGYNKNETTSLVGSQENLRGNSILGITYWTEITEDQPIGTIYGYKTDGIVQLGEDLSGIPLFTGKTLRHGDCKYTNKNDDSAINEDDLLILGSANPDFTFGLNNTFNSELRNSSSSGLTVYSQGAVGNEIVNFNKFSLESFDGYRNNSTAVLNRWTPDNPTNSYPRVTTKTAGNILSGHYVEDGSYLRIKNITLSYIFPVNIIKKFYCKGLIISAGLKNIRTFTDYSGYDPEVSRFANNNLSMGAGYGSYPMSKSYEFGLRMNF